MYVDLNCYNNTFLKTQLWVNVLHNTSQISMYTVLQGVIGKVGVVVGFFFTLMTNPIKLFLKYLEISAQCIGSLLVSWPCCSGELCGSWVLCFYLKKTTTGGSIEENQRCRFNLTRKMYSYETAKNCSVISLFYKIIICTLFSL